MIKRIISVHMKLSVSDNSENSRPTLRDKHSSSHGYQPQEVTIERKYRK